MMWKRNSRDPLARLFLDRYGLHLLRQPREDVAVGDVYSQHDRQVLYPGRLENLIQPTPELPPVRAGENMADVSGTTSNAISGELGFSFLDSILSALGAIGLSGSLQARFNAKRATGLRFRFAHATRDYADPFATERKLRRHKFDKEDSLIKTDYRYYLVVGVIRSDAITFTAVDEHSNAVSLDVDAIQLASVGAGVEVQQSATDEVIVAGPNPMAFGVQLLELLYNDRRRRLELAVFKDMIQVRADEPTELPGAAYSMIGEPEDDLFLPQA